MNRLASTFLFFSISFSVLAQNPLVNHWETAVYDTTVWKYALGTSDPGSSWKNYTFDDSGWLSGRGGIGYGDGDDGTIVADGMPSVFLRKQFRVFDSTKIAEVVLSMDYDDGFIAYLNGVEIARANVGNGAIAYNAGTPTDHEALLYQNVQPDHYEVDPELLFTGINVLTVEVHNVNTSSSDLTARPFLSFGMTQPAHTYYPIPSWFTPPISLGVQSSNLPIVVISTNGQQVISNTKIVADMGLIDNGPGQRNGFGDAFNNFSGKISIEVHGESSQGFPKKSYRIETQDGTGANLNAPLLGMGSDNDWILYATYTDKSMLRNFLAYTLGQKLGRYYAPHFRFCEMVLNGSYNGVYMLVEKIKQGKNRVPISKLKVTDVAGDNLTGGYLLRVDKIDPGNYPAWQPVPSPHLPGEGDPTFQYQDPKGEDMADAQRTYIRNYVQQMESNLSSTTFTDPVSGYNSVIDANSFIDFMLVEEISKNVDSYVYSTYLYKDKDSKGGKITMGPLWDFDLGFGNVDYNSNSQFAPGWSYSEAYRMFWFRRLMQADSFADSVKCRWNALRQNYLSTEWIMNTLDSTAVVLNEAQGRNYQQWPILGVYVWPNQYVGTTYQDEVNFLKQWVTDRLAWMDANLRGTCGGETVTGLETARAASVFPNPTDGAFKIQFQTAPQNTGQVIISDVAGRPVSVSELTVDEDLIWDSSINNSTPVRPGIYIVEVRSGGASIFRSKLIKL